MQWPICVSHVTHSTKCIQGMFGSPGSQPAEQEGIGENKNKQKEQEEKGALPSFVFVAPLLFLRFAN